MIGATVFEICWQTYTFVLLQQKILQRPKQERAQSAFLPVRSAQRVVLKHMLEKTLNHILSVPRRITPAMNECIKRWPVGFAEGGERLSFRLIRLEFARLHNDRPMRRLKRRTAFLQRPGNRFRRC